MSIKNNEIFVPMLIAWEITRTCYLNCKHCRAHSVYKSYPGELTTEECRRLLDNIASFCKPIIILTGGEPMMREDIYDIASYGNSLGMRMVMSPCGWLLTEDTVHKLINAGIKRISISLDGATSKTHDEFRQVEGAFEKTLEGLGWARKCGLEFQINTTITKHNIKELPKILDMAIELGAVAFNPFLLVPTGRGRELIDMEISPEEYENTLKWIYEKSLTTNIIFKPTCAPHYFRIMRQQKTKHRTQNTEHRTQNTDLVVSGQWSVDAEAQRHKGTEKLSIVDCRLSIENSNNQQLTTNNQDNSAVGNHQITKLSNYQIATSHQPSAISHQPSAVSHPGLFSMTRGCLGGHGFAFISHIGKIQICGFLDVECGDLKTNNFNFKEIWDNSDVFKKMRNINDYTGRCGRCEYWKICGGCRARAYVYSADYMTEEPFCVYQPKGQNRDKG